MQIFVLMFAKVLKIIGLPQGWHVVVDRFYLKLIPVILAAQLSHTVKTFVDHSGFYLLANFD